MVNVQAKVDAQRAKNLKSLAAELGRAGGTKKLLPLLLDIAIEAVWAERGFFVRVNAAEEGPRFEAEFARGFDREALRNRAGVSQSVVSRVHRRARGLVTTSEEDQDLLALSSVRNRRVLSIICVPVFEDGALRRILYLDHRFRPDSFSEEDLGRLDRLMEYAGRALEVRTKGPQRTERLRALSGLVERLGEEEARKPTTRKAKVMLVGDQVAAREGLARVIGAEPDLAVCAQASAGHEGLAAAKESSPQAVLVDLGGGSTKALDFLKDLKIRQPEAASVVLVRADQPLLGERCMRAGARGIVSSSAPTAEVIVAIRRVVGGEVFISETLSSQVLDALSGTSDQGPIARLSNRELQVFELIGEGKGTRLVAEALHLSVKTVESHNANIKKKLGLKSASELQREAVRWVARSQ